MPPVLNELSLRPRFAREGWGPFNATVVDILDGDTIRVEMVFTVELPCGHAVHVPVREKLRLRDVDAPKGATPEGRAAKAFLEGLLAIGSTCVVLTYRPTFDRYEADVLLPNGRDVAQELLHAGLAVPWKA